MTPRRYGHHVGQDERLLLGSSFGAAATAYAEHRPDYGQDAEATLGRIRAFLASRPETARGEFTLPMLTGVLRVGRV